MRGKKNKALYGFVYMMGKIKSLKQSSLLILTLVYIYLRWMHLRSQSYKQREERIGPFDPKAFFHFISSIYCANEDALFFTNIYWDYTVESIHMHNIYVLTETDQMSIFNT